MPHSKNIIKTTITFICYFAILLYLAPQLTLAAGPTLPNPLGDSNQNIRDVVLRGLQVILGLIDIVALFMFVLGGFELLTSRGNPDMVKKGKETLVWATIGILVITLSYAILKFVFESLTKVST
jgi:hypothetical protein